MLQQKRNLWLTLGLVLFVGLSSLCAQTTAALFGSVVDDRGEALPGATVIATHVPSGSKYGTVTRENGLFAIQNMRVGGPYSVVVTFSGFHETGLNDVYLNLNQKVVHRFAMTPKAAQLGEVVIVDGQYDILRANRTGAETNINAERIATIPNIARSQEGLTKLNPMAAEGGSFGGRNDQFNGLTLDGAIFNNPFGLDASTPGGQADAQPVSLDAIEQVSVAIAPYDVSQAGFTGAAVNAVTKSGTNEWKGTVFGFFRNKNMIGDKVDGTSVNRGDLEQTQGGFSLGGPIAKDEAFIFINYEQSRLSDFGSYFLANRGTDGPNISRVLASDLDLVSSALKSRYGYETGAYENFIHKTNSDKFLVKVDWNAAPNHKFSFTANVLDAFKDKPAHPSAIGRRGPDANTLQFANSGYRINNRIMGGIGELKSVFGDNKSNKLQVGITYFTDNRDPKSDPFPVLNISKNGSRYIIAGHEPFSISNKLNQQVFQISDNLNIYKGKNTWTLGASLEKFSFDNSFNLTGYGARVFFPDVPVEDFGAFINSGGLDAEVGAARAAAVANATGAHQFGNWALAETNVGQAAAYIQDEIGVNNRLNLTFGVRMDVPLFFNTEEKMQESIDRNCCYDDDIWYYKAEAQAVQLKSTTLPKSTPLFSPRFGFNYDLSGDRKSVLRGGSGVFTGRFPFVWVGNQVANPNSFFYCVTDPDFKFPQVWRSNLGYDAKIMGWVASIDAIYTKDINAMMVRNYGLRSPNGTLKGDGDTRPVYNSYDRTNTAYVFTNTSVGESINAGVQLERNFYSMYVKLGYNYLDAKDASSIDAEISSDAYDRNPANIQNTNQAQLANSLYGNKHRLLGLVSKKFTYGRDGKMGTTLSLFTEFVRGGRFSYTYSGDLNNDGSGLNDLLYVPTDAQIDNMAFVPGVDATEQQQRDAFKAYIAQDDYLSGLRGKYTEKYANLSPWFNHWDLRLAQDLGLRKKQNLQFTMDILNLGNLISDKWGVRQYATYTGLVQPVAYSGNDANGKPNYQFDVSQKSTFFNDFSLLSRWQMQLGLRYSF